MNQPPENPAQGKALETEAADARLGDVGTTQQAADTGPGPSTSGVKEAVKSFLTVLGTIVVGLVIIGLWAGPSEDSDVEEGHFGTSDARLWDEDNLSESAERGLDSPDAATNGDDEWHPSMLCTDEQVLGEVVNMRREWLRRLLTDMAEEGSYITPNAGNPIAEGVGHARFTFPAGQQFVRLSYSDEDVGQDAIRVSCLTAMEVHGAFKLPDGTWSDAYLALPDSGFDIWDGSEGLSVGFSQPHEGTATAILNIAGAPFRLSNFREGLKAE